MTTGGLRGCSSSSRCCGVCSSDTKSGPTSEHDDVIVTRTVTGRVTMKPPDGNLGVFPFVRNGFPTWVARSLLSSNALRFIPK